MADIFQLGQEASKSTFVQALKDLQAQGAGVLETLESARLASLVEFDRRLQAVNARRTRSWRVTSPEQAIKFVVSDFTDVDQANTTGTVRADSTSVSLKERAVPAEAVIKTNNFSSNKGTIEALDSAQTILRVHTDDFSTPTGQFDIELVTPLTLSQLILDIVATPSAPSIVVFTSGDGLTYTSATKIALNGYRVNAWLPSQETRFIRVQITPSHPDELNGNTFTFGITSFSAQATDYHLRSEMLTKTLSFIPKSEYVVFDAPQDVRVQYYLSIFAQGDPQAPLIEVDPGDALKIGTAVEQTSITNASLDGLIASIPSTVYINTIVVKEAGVEMKFAPGLSPSDSKVSELTNEYVGLVLTSLGYDLHLIRSDSTYTTTRTFDVSYVYGPSLVKVQLKVRLSTDDRATSPVFQGAVLDDE